jgi:DNA-binding response OmpR family regulator
MPPPIALILDDDEDFAWTLGELLQQAGFAVTWATSVEEARGHIEAHPIAIVLLDLELGGRKGRYLLDDLAGIDHAPPMIVLSGAADGPQIAAYFGIACVRKPFQVDELLAAIDVACTFDVRPVRRNASGRRAAVVLPFDLKTRAKK